jgi:hypothetical protein
MSGTDVEQYSGRGINYRALDDLFSIQQQRADEVRIGRTPSTATRTAA